MQLDQEEIELLNNFLKDLTRLLALNSKVGVDDFKIYVGENALAFKIDCTDGIPVAETVN